MGVLEILIPLLQFTCRGAKVFVMMLVSFMDTFIFGGIMRLQLEDAKKFKSKYGTPLYIYDVDTMKSIMQQYKNNFISNAFETEVLYASKAFCIKEMLRLVKSQQLSLDVVSMGELYTAKVVDFDMKKIYFHGNNKSSEELTEACNLGVGTIVVDNYMELLDVVKITEASKSIQNIMIRLNVGVEAHTHKFIVTAHVDSKFGVAYGSSEYNQMLSLIQQSKNICLIGFHSHIGSQIFDLEAFDAAICKLIAICNDFEYPLTLNLGGGFGVKYTEEDLPIPFDVVAKHLISTTERHLKEKGLKLKKLCIEPGRSIVATSGSTLYTIGNIKQTPNKLYYFIDGGMTDNIRPALYQAKYDADIIGKEEALKSKKVTVAGKCCESGDIIIEHCLLPEAKKGDFLITYTTGAYGYSMSSNYNKALTPAVVFIENGKERLVVRRQSLEELIEREL